MPNQGYFTNIASTDRTNQFTIQFNEQPNGSVIVLGFDLTGAGIPAGEGAILNLLYESTSIYQSNISVDFSLEIRTDSGNCLDANGNYIGGTCEYDDGAYSVWPTSEYEFTLYYRFVPVIPVE